LEEVDASSATHLRSSVATHLHNELHRLPLELLRLGSVNGIDKNTIHPYCEL
jgi:hypothetical protein